MLDEMIAAVRAGRSRGLVVRGDAGVGKSALLQYVSDRAAPLRVLRAAGVESEMELAFAGVHQLCLPLLDLLPRIPAPQRAALETVFGSRPGPPPDRFLVALALLSLLSVTAERTPLLCLVDDTHWLDEASAQVLGIVARRLLADPIGMLFGARDPGPALTTLPQLTVTGLGDADARHLLESATRSTLDPRIRDRVLADADGNPLALIELPRGRSITELAGGLGMLDAAGAPDRVERRFMDRMAALPASTRTLLLVAAAEPLGDAGLVWSALRHLGVTPSEATDADLDGLCVIDLDVRFRHPLVRSAVYRSADPADQRAAHRALAEVTDPVIDPDRRAWHLAAAAPGPDEEIAAELERSAERSRATGGVAAAAALLRGAVELTVMPDQRARRALAAGDVSLLAGDFDTARRLADAAYRDAVDDIQRARAQLLSAHIAFASGFGPEASRKLQRAARRLEPHDMALARETYLLAWRAARFTADETSLPEIGQAVRRLPTLTAPRPIDLVLDGLTAVVIDDRRTSVPALRRAAEAFRHAPAADAVRWGWVVSGVAPPLWDEQVMHTMYNRQLDLVRTAGAMAELPAHLTNVGIVASFFGDLTGADALVAEAADVAGWAGVPIAPFAAMHVASMRGRVAEAAPLLTSTAEWATAAGQGLGLAAVRWCEAILYNGLARFDEALLAAAENLPAKEPWIATWTLPELIEAAVRAGHPERGRDALARLIEATEPCGTDWAAGIAARCRALLADGMDADQLYREAIARLSRTQLRPEQARAHLLYGEWLCRNGRPQAARGPLRIAYDMFVDVGMEAFAERAHLHLVQTGVSRPKRRATPAAATGELTTQETLIAQLVRDGLTNPEIGARLFLSPRTVEWHLRKVFTKLAVTSRRELRTALSSTGRAAGP